MPPNVSTYTVCVRVSLRDADRERLLCYCRATFPTLTSMTPGQLIQHAIGQFGRNVLAEAIAWNREQEALDVNKGPLAEKGEQGGGKDHE